MDKIIFDGRVYSKWESERYYRNSTTKERLHRAVWKFHNGDIAKGLDVHHIDGNRFNNSIDNLELISRKEHALIHLNIHTPKAVEARYKVLRSAEYRMKQSAIAKSRPTVDKVCRVCGGGYKTNATSKSWYCSRKCANKSRYL